MVEEGETDPEFDAILATVDPNGYVNLNHFYTFFYLIARIERTNAVGSANSDF